MMDAADGSSDATMVTAIGIAAPAMRHLGHKVADGRSATHSLAAS